MWKIIIPGSLAIVLVILAFYAGYRLGLTRRRERLSPEEFHLLGEDYEIKMRMLIDENKELCRQWRATGQLMESLGAIKEKSRFYQVTARLLKDTLRADYSAVFIRSEDAFLITASEGLHVRLEEAFGIPGNDSFLDYLDNFTETVILTEKDRQFKLFEKMKEKFSVLMVFPLKVGRELYGILWVARKPVRPSFSEGDKMVLAHLGNTVAYLIKNIDVLEEIEERTLRTIVGLSKALEKKDELYRGHSDHVARYAVMFCNHIGISEDEIKTIKLAALLHDIGTIGVPDRILNKPGELTSEEFEKVKVHPLLGAELLKPIGFLKDELLIILHHHEKFDGTGYPYRLQGIQIPRGAQIVSLVNVFDALTSDRPYRKAYDIEAALQIMEEMSGKNFDPGLLNQFIGFIQHQISTRRISTNDRT